MVTLSRKGVFVIRGRLIMEDADRLSPEEINNRLVGAGLTPLPGERITGEKARRGTMAYRILAAHNQSGDPRNLKLRVDSMASRSI